MGVVGVEGEKIGEGESAGEESNKGDESESGRRDLVKNNVKPMRITERDKKVLRAINRFGYADARFVSSYFNWHKKLTYRRLNKLTQHNFLHFDWIFQGKAGVYRVTRSGAELSQDHLPPVRRINLATYDHQLRVLSLSLRLLDEHGGEFVSERDLRHQLGINTNNSKVHVPDGVLILNEQRVAIEVELSVKSQQRIEKILHHYRKDFSYQSVWYYCGTQEVQNKIDRINTNDELIKTHLLKP